VPNAFVRENVIEMEGKIMAHDVFLSHSSKDKKVADAVCAGLEAEGIRCWVAPRDIKPGQNWGEAIVSGINNCTVMVIIFSNHSNQSDHVLREIERAVNNGSVLIPFRIENVEPSAKMEYFLSVPHWLDAMSKPLARHIAALARNVESIIANTEGIEPEHEHPQSLPAARWERFKNNRLAMGALVMAILLTVLFGISRLIVSSPGHSPGEESSTDEMLGQETHELAGRLEKGGLLVKSKPGGALVSLGSRALKTPAAFNDIKIGKSAITVTLEGYDTVEMEVKITADEMLDLGTIEMERSLGSVRVESDNAGRMYSFERVAGDLPIMWSDATPATENSIPVGEYYISLADPDWPGIRKIEVVKGKTTLVAFKRGSANITTNPSGAMVRQDGKAIGTTPLKLDKVKPGKTFYQLELDGYFLSAIELDVDGGRQVDVHRELEKGQGPKPETGEMFTASNGMVLVWIPAGYWAGRFEVTQDEFERVMERNPSSSLGPRKPVETVSLGDAKVYCAKLTALDHANGILPEGFVYSLPSRAHWNYFKDNASSRQGNSHSSKEALDNVETAEDLGKLMASSKGQSSQSVGMSPPNTYGINDVLGNVWEWEAGTNSIVYGGGWSSAWNDPIARTSEVLGKSAGPHGAIGFRCVAIKGMLATKKSGEPADVVKTKTDTQKAKAVASAADVKSPRAIEEPTKGGAKSSLKIVAENSDLDGELGGNGTVASEKVVVAHEAISDLPPDGEELDRVLRELETMVPVRGGQSQIGCGPKDSDGGGKYCSSSDGPLHEVLLDGFFIDVTEVTRDEFKRCVDSAACTPPKSGGNCTWGEPGKGNHPANCIDWYQATAFCKWADKRLCTSAEWEKSARGNDKRIYPWGNEPVTCERAIVMNCDTKGPQPVGSRPLGVSPYGAMDMAGNVWEWVSDSFQHDYYLKSPRFNPKGPEKDGPYVVRGASYSYRAKHTRTHARHYWYPDKTSAELGFRCCKSPVKEAHQ
jgi:formylglycine-generating enzyme